MTKYLYLYLLFLGLVLVFFSYYKMGRIYGGEDSKLFRTFDRNMRVCESSRPKVV